MSEPRFAVERVNGIAMAFRHWPAPRRATHPPVVLLHGVLQTGEGLRHLADRLALGGEVLAPDLRGRGQTEAPPSGYDPATMADDVGALIEFTGIERPVAIGRLHGGLVAYHLAARRPDLVRGVVLAEANPEVSAERASRVREAMRALPRSFPSREAAERFYAEGLGLPAARAQHDIPLDLETAPDGALRWRHDLDLVLRIEAEATPRADWEILAQVRCPALVLRGQRGELRAETKQRLMDVMPRVQVLTIYGAGPEVFLGPGSEQAQSALELFLLGLDGRAS